MKIYQHHKIGYKFILTLSWVPILALNHSLTAQPTDLPVTVREWRSDSLIFEKGLLKSVNPLWHKWHVKQACRVRTIKFPLGKMFFYIGHMSIYGPYMCTQLHWTVCWCCLLGTFMSIVSDTEMPNCSVQDAHVMPIEIQAPRQSSSPDLSITPPQSHGQMQT